MNSPSQEHRDRALSPPHDAFYSKLNLGLEAAIRERQSATPEPAVEPPDYMSLQTLCNWRRESFKPREADNLRQQLITYTPYFSCEVSLYRAKIYERLENGQNNPRDVLAGLKGFARHLGIYEHIEECRYTICDPNYWQAEIEAYELALSHREHKAKRRLQRAAQRAALRQRQRHRQASVSTGSPRIMKADRVSDRTRSKTRARREK